MFQNERNRLTQVCHAFIVRSSLTIRARHFRAVRHEPGPVLLDDRGELVSHNRILSEWQAEPPAPPQQITSHSYRSALSGSARDTLIAGI
jgi:hypothetical protein